MQYNDEPNEDEDGEMSIADPMTAQQIEDRKKDHIKKFLINHKGFEEDEIDTLFPAFADLEKFYSEVRAASGLVDANDKEFDTPGKKMPKDDKTLIVSATDKRRIAELKKARNAYKKRLKELQAMIQAGDIDTEDPQGIQHSKHEFEEAGSGLPPQERLSYEDFMKSIGVDDIDKLLEDMD